MISSEERKANTEALLTRLGVPVNRYLPVVEDELEVRLRDAAEVAKRCGVLYARAGLGHDCDQDAILGWLSTSGFWDNASTKEKEFFENPELSEQCKREATWEVEKINVLLWSLGRVAETGLPCRLCDVRLIQDVLPSLCAGESNSIGKWHDFVHGATLRPVNAILDSLDLIYRIDWAVVECKLHNQPPPAGFNPGVVYERHFALNWLTCYAADWDDITCDT
jgi:hypothetical protein